MRYICLGYFDEQAWNSLSEDEQSKLFDKCLDYDAELRRGGHYVGGEALQSAQSAATVRIDAGKVLVTDGPFAETTETLGGILILEARDLNHAIALISQHPGLAIGPFEVRPVDEETMAKFRARLSL